MDDAYELAYREAVRALEHQYATVSELRGRASMLLAAASITLSLPGGQVLDRSEPFGWLALVAFVLLGLCMVAIIWPRSGWRFDTDSRDLLAKHLAVEGGAQALTWELIAQLANNRALNARRLSAVVQAFRVGACLLAIQMVATIAAASGIL